MAAGGSGAGRTRASPLCSSGACGDGVHQPRVPHYYDQALRLLSRRGLVRAPATGVREFADSASQQLSEPAARAFSTLTECYLADRFGRPTAHPADLQALRRALRPSRSRGAANTASESAIADPL